MKRRKRTNVHRTLKRKGRPVAQTRCKTARGCGWVQSITRTISPVLKALGIGKLK